MKSDRLKDRSLNADNIDLTTPDSPEIFDEVFGSNFDRFQFPGNIHRVTSGHGGEAILIIGSEKTALIDCGMAYCGDITVSNIKKVLKANGRSQLDYVFLTHSHYDHIGALPYIKRAFSECVVYGSRHCSDILIRPNARKLMKQLGEEAKGLYNPNSEEEILVDGLSVDVILGHGGAVWLGGEPDSKNASNKGGERIIMLETKGHTDCSVTYVLEPIGLMFTSESTGIIEGTGYVNTPFLKGFNQARESYIMCRDYGPKFICLPHFGMIPQDFIPEYWHLFEAAYVEKLEFIRSLRDSGLDYDEILEEYVKKYWMEKLEEEQPKEAFMINSRSVVKVALRELEGEVNYEF